MKNKLLLKKIFTALIFAGLLCMVSVLFFKELRKEYAMGILGFGAILALTGLWSMLARLEDYLER